ncbi:hypothetical protein C8R47DRAFT_1134609 [Mycena vitilis]|nr:hypothetical protein C8R47DRAFT_1134609 [Mycena vitilis]
MVFNRLNALLCLSVLSFVAAVVSGSCRFVRDVLTLVPAPTGASSSLHRDSCLQDHNGCRAVHHRTHDGLHLHVLLSSTAFCFH